MKVKQCKIISAFMVLPLFFACASNPETTDTSVETEKTLTTQSEAVDETTAVPETTAAVAPPETEADTDDMDKSYIELTTANMKNKIDQTGQQLMADYNVLDIDEGVAIVLYYFAADSAVLTSEDHKKLNDIIGVIELFSPKSILVRGHTAFAGSAGGRRAIAEARAKIVHDVLTASRIGARVPIESVGVGATVPLTGNETRSGRNINRRAEIILVKQ